MRVGIEKRIAGAEKVGAHKTSMLQDVEHGRPLEIEALVGAVIELGALTGTPTPHIDAVYAVHASLLAKTIADANGHVAGHDLRPKPTMETTGRTATPEDLNDRMTHDHRAAA